MFEGRIEGVFGVESPEDVLKLLDEKLISQEIKNNQQEAKLLQEKKKAAAKQPLMQITWVGEIPNLELRFKQNPLLCP